MRFAYEKTDGTIHWLEQPFSAGPAPEQLEVDGEIAKRSRSTERTGGPPSKGWPMVCYASGVNAAQAQALRDEFKRVGVPTEVTVGGDPIYTSAEHRRRALKARGLFDRSAFC